MVGSVKGKRALGLHSLCWGVFTILPQAKWGASPLACSQPTPRHTEMSVGPQHWARVSGAGCTPVCIRAAEAAAPPGQQGGREPTFTCWQALSPLLKDEQQKRPTRACWDTWEVTARLQPRPLSTGKWSHPCREGLPPGPFALRPNTIPGSRTRPGQRGAGGIILGTRGSAILLPLLSHLGFQVGLRAELHVSHRAWQPGIPQEDCHPLDRRPGHRGMGPHAVGETVQLLLSGAHTEHSTLLRQERKE